MSTRIITSSRMTLLNTCSYPQYKLFWQYIQVLLYRDLFLCDPLFVHDCSTAVEEFDFTKLLDYVMKKSLLKY